MFRGLSVKYILLGITYLCNSYITEEEINDLEKLLYLCYLVVLLREVTIHISNRLWNLVFPRIRKGSSLCRFDWKENPEKGLRQWKKNILELKSELVCVRKKKQFWKSCNHFKVYKKCKSAIQKKKMKFSELLTKISFFFYFRDRLKNGE